MGQTQRICFGSHLVKAFNGSEAWVFCFFRRNNLVWSESTVILMELQRLKNFAMLYNGLATSKVAVFYDIVVQR